MSFESRVLPELLPILQRSPKFDLKRDLGMVRSFKLPPFEKSSDVLMYLGDKTMHSVSPYAAPSRAKDLTVLPPAYTCVGELDPFRDETMEYVARLAQAGIPVEFHLYPGCFHGFDSTFNNTEISRQANTEYINALARALNSKQGFPNLLISGRIV